MQGGAKLQILVMAAGSGERAGPGVSKQYRPIFGVPLLRRTIDTLKALLPEAGVRVVISPEHAAAYTAAMAGSDLPPPLPGGPTRQESVRKGLEALEADQPDIVLIHDAARPFLSGETVAALLDRLQGDVDGAAPGLAVLDTVKRCAADGLVSDTVDRRGLWRVQTPQAFRYAAILAAHRSAPPDLTDDLAVAEAHGLRVAVVPGDERTFKITTSADFRAAEAVLINALPDVRTGTGFDVHAFSEGDHVTLCGVKVPHSHGLLGHSDADVGLHAITDAILGALGAGDIGMHFPPSDERWRGAASDRFLLHTADLVRVRGGVISHVDVTLICEAPKVGPHRDAMVTHISEILGLPGRVSVKATTTEKLGFTGRREGIAAQAVATLRLPA
ncbi:MAG: bifunctional 2-C-methyl-D-erythritol 4-phosphate cytidylyltransferase/2-C-methyl-D-erythritol 2,4-cyclodiphosphate synthase [Alphaproteobacteria bacterium]|nr:bifunctional 2-C-methyl-D-erythritol 4-phosphate cytidylyltransferase/2-C-methyl-D-erythritol 2,4-cyclodiphosphate synthase [Alphaproteobacteria bacterium]